MVSINPATQPTDMRHMYDFSDFRSKETQEKCFDPKSLAGILKNQPDFSIFFHIVKKSFMEAKLGDLQADFTLFVPSDAHLLKRYKRKNLECIDKGLALQIVKMSLMNRQIDSKLLKASPVSTFPTLNRSNSIQIQNVNNQTYLPCNTQVIHWNQPANNGIIHVTNNMLFPDDNMPIWSW